MEAVWIVVGPARGAVGYGCASAAADFTKLAIPAETLELCRPEIARVSEVTFLLPNGRQGLVANITFHESLSLQRQASKYVTVVLDSNEETASRAPAPESEFPLGAGMAEFTFMVGIVADTVSNRDLHFVTALRGDNEIGDGWQVARLKEQLGVLHHATHGSAELQLPHICPIAYGEILHVRQLGEIPTVDMRD
jgi:hypothetical protein